MSDTPTSWGPVAEWYDRLLASGRGTFQAEVILPNLRRLMGLKKGERVLDLACGQGFFSAAFAADGARVVGVDVAPELVRLAKKNAPRGAAEFHVAASHELAMLADASFDKVAVILAIQNIADVKGTFAECRRVLAPGGRLYLVLNHPAFRVPKGSSWGWDKGGAQYRRVDKYLGESRSRIQMRPGDDPELVTVSFHRPLQFYVKALARSGFCVANLEEWISHRTSDSGPRAKEENRARKEIPLFLFIEAAKKD